MARDYSKCKIEFCVENTSCESREVYWRIVPSELPWYKRWFNNSWRYMYHAIYIYLNPNFHPDDYQKIKKQLHTYEDVIKYLKNEELKATKLYNQMIKDGKIWPTENIWEFIR